MLTVLLAPGSLNHTANIIKGFAIAIGIAVAVGFVWMWWAHRQRERRQELASRARGVWAGWLRLAVDHPSLTDPRSRVVADPVEIARYKTLVAALLCTADEVLMLEDSPLWRATLLRHLEPHRTWLASDEFRATTLADCSPALQALIRPLTGAG